MYNELTDKFKFVNLTLADQFLVTYPLSILLLKITG